MSERPITQTHARYSRVYLCYSRKDQAVVTACAQVLSALGIASDPDIFMLEPGTDWRAQVFRMIDEADVFFLFWSEAAAGSQEVRREVLHALDRQKRSRRGLPQIVPVVLSIPTPTPPPELSSLHFDGSFSNFVRGE